MYRAMVGRIPVMDVSPVVECGRYPAKAAVGEAFPVTAAIFKEGHDELNADLVVTGPDGTRRPPGPDESRTPPSPTSGTPDVTPDVVGPWTYGRVVVRPVATWRHAAEIKIPAGIDVDLMLAEGALLLERAARAAKRGAKWQVVRDAVRRLRA